MAELTFRVTGMTCAHCRKAVQNAAESVPGVESVSVELESGSLRIETGPDFDVRALRNAVEEEGYRLC